jgi:phage baseplate assembly protein W
MARDGTPLGSGWRFPIELDGRGGVATAADEEKIRQSIHIILSTAKGERVMRPDFGCDIHEFVFGSMDRTTCTMIEASVHEALIMWEPRIDVESVVVSTERYELGILEIALTYRIRATNAEFNLVYPFHLEAGA